MIGVLSYLLLFAVVCAPGLPIGFALFGRRHAAGWVAGSLVGYGLSATSLWAVVQAGTPSLLAFGVTLAALNAVTWSALRNAGPWVSLPAWRRRDTVALLLVLLVVPLLQWRPFTRIGEPDAGGARRYRAYFTADFLWHVALTAELTKGTSPPRNPYLARRPLHYYWAYFVPPAVIAGHAPVLPDIRAHLLVNAFGAGVLFVAAIFLLAWTIVPRAGPVAAAVVCTILAGSAEGAYALWDLWSRGQPLAGVRQLNIDAITAWWFQTLTIDGLPRSLWYTPQHAMSCALSLMALVTLTRDGVAAGFNRQSLAPPLAAGVALGLAVIFSPFLGGAFSVIYGLAAAWTALRTRALASIATAALAGLPVVAALGWCAAAGTFEGSGGAVALGLSRRAAAAPLSLLALALGPVLALAVLALLLRTWRQWPISTAVIAVVTGLFMLYFVTLTLEEVWIGWRAGQIILVTLPGLVAAALARLVDLRHRALAVGAAVLALALGLPTTIIDAYNAQDVSNTQEAAGFRWTVVVTPDTQAALAWVRDNTPSGAIVQMSIGPRRRETWTLIPTFAERRMAAGRPISLLHSPEYDQYSDQVDALYRGLDPSRAAAEARALRIDYLWIDKLEREAFGTEAAAKFDAACCFTRVFASGDAAVYQVK